MPAASVTITNELGLRVAHISYQGDDSQFARVGMRQEINESAEFYSTIELSATVKLVGQERPVPATGTDLYPLTIRIVYSDSDGKDHEWKRSFYLSSSAENLGDLSGVKVPVGKWVSTVDVRDARREAAESQGRSDLANINADLFMLKSPGQNPPPDIAMLRVIEVYGYGTEFESGITGISLLGR
jgi:hypothetical protein